MQTAAAGLFIAYGFLVMLDALADELPHFQELITVFAGLSLVLLGVFLL